jgi:hypothetical protein
LASTATEPWTKVRNQISVFGRVGARPLNAEEMRRMYMHPARGLWRVTDGARDWTITDPAEREANLIDQLAPIYGRPSRGPASRPQSPAEPLVPPSAPTLPEVIAFP